MAVPRSLCRNVCACILWPWPFFTCRYLLPRLERGGKPRLTSAKEREHGRVKGLKHAYAKFGLGPSWEIKLEEERQQERRRQHQKRLRLEEEARRRQRELEELERARLELAEKKKAQKAQRKKEKKVRDCVRACGTAPT